LSGNGQDEGNGKPRPEEEPAESGLQEAPAPDEAATLRREVADLKDQLLRRRADFENYKKRMERDRENAGHEMAEKIFAELIPALDNLERALGATGDDGSLRTGVELIYRELLAVFERNGVKAHDPTGQLFDPTTHQALSHEVVPGMEEGTVAEAFRKGYSYRDRLLRPALVKVAKGPEDADGTEEDAAEAPAREH